MKKVIKRERLTPYFENEFGKLYHGDCLEIMPKLAITVGLVLCDPPYQKTKNKWDTVISFSKMWDCINNLSLEGSFCVFTAAQPYTTMLINSNFNNFKYCDVWDKKHPKGFLNAKKLPLRRHEDVVVFNGTPTRYFPIMRKGRYRNKKCGGSNNGCYGEFTPIDNFNDDYYPTSIIEISAADQTNKVHPTQKPVSLMEYLIKTYSIEGEIVLDFAAGSGTTGVAAIKTNRKYILIEKEEKYCEIAAKRLYSI